MDIDALQKKLIAAAKANPPRESVPYAFEKRITARLTGRVVLDEWGLWVGPLWRAAVPCVAIMVVLGAWSLFPVNPRPASSDLSQDIENTVLAAVEQEQTSDSIW
jgi:hypothetical protein